MTLSNISSPTPIIGFSAFSGTGKTTLLTRLIPELKKSGVRLGVIKHAHHDFDIDHAEKDSYKLRHAGAQQMLISSARRWALMHELTPQEKNPREKNPREKKPGEKNNAERSLQELVDILDHSSLDLVLVEGFKRESFAKIELHRASLGRPLLHPEDANIIAIANDSVESDFAIPRLDLNNPRAIADFVIEYAKL